ncbi:hypothetical protein TUM4438_15220 [Shewanella sairae]|uniref:Uncharacterized protein n=1 Tax=Shewanella sairae TaxID=190310 RepID=A0ABQ4PA16_9GAMM|nr:hypothetical protein [Shewanella sairae]MCL1132286.1 hypothetical protein [Shewanella sairae]GIU44311.1 hypothetical protein TUM4438_15220 [Shewanella sairae]
MFKIGLLILMLSSVAFADDTELIEPISRSANNDGMMPVTALLDIANYPVYSGAALTAIVTDLKRFNIELTSLYFIGRCTPKSCLIDIAPMSNFINGKYIPKCHGYCVHFGYSNQHQYIIKKAHLR